jgi:uncharacterized protein (TIGR02588 family)
MSDDSRSPSLETLLSMIGALVVIAVLAFLAFEAFVADGRGPQLSASIVRTEAADGQHVVHYKVHNDGSRTAEQVHVVGELVKDGKALEQVSSTIAYVPMGSSRTGVLVFARSPAGAQLEVRAVSYTTP